MILSIRFLLAALASFVFLLAVGAIFHPLVFPNGAPGQLLYPRDQPLLAPRLAALLVTAGLLAYIYPKGYGGKKPWAEGLRFGMLMGALFSIPTNLLLFATADVQAAALVTAVFWTVITWGISGGLIGAVYGNSLRAS